MSLLPATPILPLGTVDVLRLYEKGLVYRKNAVVNWDPEDQTVLANEQVVDGRGWRSGAVVERREMAQWFLKSPTTPKNCSMMDDMPGWPESVKSMQRNWIGRSEGAEIDFVTEHDPRTNLPYLRLVQIP